MTVDTKAAPRERFQRFLQEKQLQPTRQREIVVDCVFATQQHFTAEELLQWAQQKDQRVSRATVYRTLLLLVQCNLVLEMQFGTHVKFYYPNAGKNSRRTHVFCRDCEQITALDSDCMARLEREVSSLLNIRLTAVQLQMTVHCGAPAACPRKTGRG